MFVLGQVCHLSEQYNVIYLYSCMIIKQKKTSIMLLNYIIHSAVNETNTHTRIPT